MNKAKLAPQQINKLLERFTQKELAEILGVSARTIRNQKKENDKPKKKRGRKSKIDSQSALFFVLGLYNDNKHSTQQEMADYLSKQTGKKISRYTISRILKKFEITRKKSTNHYLEQAKHIRKISRFKKIIIPRLLQSRVLALDECSFHLNETPRYSYAHKSYRANSQKPSNQGNNHTLMLCIESIADKGVIHYELMEGGMKTENFHNFLSQINLLGKGKKYLIMDNLKVHHAKQSCVKLKLIPIKDLLRSKSIKPIYLPPYTPELNPTELCFNFIRHYVKKNKPRNYEELKLVIDKIMVMLNEKNLTEYFRHCFDYDYQWMPRNKNFNFFVSKKQSAIISSIFQKAQAY